MSFDPLDTARRALWISGAQWAGKTTVARNLAARHGLTVYLYDRHDARAHDDRRIADRLRRSENPDGLPPDQYWVERTPEEMATEALAGFSRRFEWALDDLSALYSPRPVIADGWGLRPELVSPLVNSLRQILVMVPTEEFRRHQLQNLPRAATIGIEVRDPERAQRNRVDRDRLIARDAVHHARRLGIRVIEVDGSQNSDAVTAIAEDHFRPFLDGD